MSRHLPSKATGLKLPITPSMSPASGACVQPGAAHDAPLHHARSNIIARIHRVNDHASGESADNKLLRRGDLHPDLRAVFDTQGLPGNRLGCADRHAAFGIGQGLGWRASHTLRKGAVMAWTAILPSLVPVISRSARNGGGHGFRLRSLSRHHLIQNRARYWTVRRLLGSAWLLSTINRPISGTSGYTGTPSPRMNGNG